MFPPPLQVQAHGCKALTRLALLPAACDALLEDGLACVCAALAGHLASTAVQRQGCSVLWNVSAQGKAYADAVVRAGGVPHVLEAMAAHVLSPTVQEQACGALLCIAAHGEDNVAALLDCDAVKYLNFAIDTHTVCVNLLTLACGTLRHIVATEDGRAAVVASGGGERIRHVRSISGDNADLRKAAEAVLRYL